MVTALVHLIARLRPALLAAPVLAVIAVCTVVGSESLAPRLFHPWLDLNGERNFTAGLSAALLAAAGVLAWLWGRSDGRQRPVAATALGGLFLFMAADEFGELHERAERLSGIDWQVLYLPVMVAGALVWLLALRRLWPLLAPRVLWLAGAAGWLVAQVLELNQYDAADVRTASWAQLVTGEESLEMLGSLAFGLALLVAIRRSAEPLEGRAPARPLVEAG